MRFRPAISSILIALLLSLASASVLCGAQCESAGLSSGHARSQHERRMIFSLHACCTHKGAHLTGRHMAHPCLAAMDTLPQQVRQTSAPHLQAAPLPRRFEVDSSFAALAVSRRQGRIRGSPPRAPASPVSLHTLLRV